MPSLRRANAGVPLANEFRDEAEQATDKDSFTDLSNRLVKPC